MTTILATDFGTFCDFKLMTELLHYLELDGHRLVYVTPKDNKAINNLSEAVRVVKFQNVTPSQMDTAIGIADTSSDTLTTLKNRLMRGGVLIDTENLAETLQQVRIPFSQLMKALNELDRMMGVMRVVNTYLEVLETAIRESQPRFVLIHYAALCQLFTIANKAEFKNIMFIVVFFAPAYPNKKTYWLFDSRLKNPRKDIYDPLLKNEYKQSHLRFADSLKVCRNGAVSVAKSWMLRMGMKESIKEVSSDLQKCGLFSRFMGRQMEAFVNKLDSVPVDWELPENVCGVRCWDPEVLPDIPVEPVLRKTPMLKWLGNSAPIGGVISRNAMSSAPPSSLPSGLSQFIQKSRSQQGLLVYLSFGSFSIGDHEDLENFVTALALCAEHMKLFVICHSKQIKDIVCDKQLSEFVFVTIGHIAHEWLVPKCNLVITTASYCLFNICMLHRVNSLLMPILPEQFFWAKNYRLQTGVEYFDYQSMLLDLTADEIAVHLQRLLQMAITKSPKQQEYLQRVSTSLQKNVAQEKLVELIRSMMPQDLVGGRRSKKRVQSHNSSYFR